MALKLLRTTLNPDYPPPGLNVWFLKAKFQVNFVFLKQISVYYF